VAISHTDAALMETWFAGFRYGSAGQPTEGWDAHGPTIGRRGYQAAGSHRIASEQAVDLGVWRVEIRLRCNSMRNGQLAGLRDSPRKAIGTRRAHGDARFFAITISSPAAGAIYQRGEAGLSVIEAYERRHEGCLD